MDAVLQLLKVGCERPTWEDVKSFALFNDARCYLESIPHGVPGTFRIVMVPKPLDPALPSEQIYVTIHANAIGLVDATIPGTTCQYWTVIDPAHGVRVTCQQSSIGYDGPVIAIMRRSHGWLTTIRPREQEAGVVRVRVSTPNQNQPPIVSLCGVRAHFNDPFDLEDDDWAMNDQA